MLYASRPSDLIFQ